IDRTLALGAPRLKIVARHGVGLDNLDLPALTEKGVVVTHVGAANAVAVAEHTLGLMLMLAKKFSVYERAVREDRYAFRDSLEATELHGKILLVIGLGRTGSAVARLANAFGMRCLGADIAFTDQKIRALGCEPARGWRPRLGEVDYLTLHVPLTNETRGMIGAAELRLMKRSAFLFNCARGGIVDETALVAALDAGRPAGAALDVQQREPLPPDDPLLACGKIVLTPHSAASTAEGMIRMARRTAQNVCDYFDGTLDPVLIANGLEPPRKPT
ncbi:MAG: NAD(P)-dependent oxidoreductase, partial [Hyphomicrobiaceae bacterium]